MASDRETTLQALLAVLGSADGPMGTRSARLALAEMGIDISESSVSRRLRELDERGWTVPLVQKGRTLSQEGRRRQKEAELSNRTTASLGQAVGVRDVRDLLDLLYARRAVESAAAANAADHATAGDVDELKELVQGHRGVMGTPQMADQPGLNLHRKIASIAPNRMLKLLTGLLLAPHLDRVEAVLDIVIGTHERQEAVLQEHQSIVDAIESRDPEVAETAMRDHFDNMLRAGQDLVVGENALVVSRLLSWMETSGSM